MEIRIAEVSDAKACTKINETIWGSEWKDPAYHRERARNGELIIALEKGNIVGYVVFRKGFWKNNYFIEEMAVDPKNQGKGIGSALIKKIEEICSTENARLFSSADSENTTSLRFHEKMGFTKAGFIKNMFKEGKKEIIFTKKSW